jgi:hypothetical protein
MESYDDAPASCRPSPCHRSGREPELLAPKSIFRFYCAVVDIFQPGDTSVHGVTMARVILAPPKRDLGRIRLSARLVGADGSTEILWWELPEQWEQWLTDWSDPWAVGFIFPIMLRGEPTHIEGTVSPSLLANLELFMRIWAIWAPDRYRPVRITADSEIEMPTANNPGLAIAAFSGGVDSCFSVLRHAKKKAGGRTLQVGAGMVQHGFDIWLDSANSDVAYAGLLSDADALLGSLGIPSLPARTNFQQMQLYWADAFATQLVSGLSLLSKRFDTALIANDIVYDFLGVRWGSHPLLNALLGSKRFEVRDDGGEFSRIEKAAFLATWPEAMRRLHVCFAAHTKGRYENCCNCEKCVRTILAFRVAGCEVPSAFKYDVTDAQIRRVRVEPTSEVIRQWEKLAIGALDRGLHRTGWTRAIRTVLRRYRWRQARNRLQQPFIPLRNKIRRLIRGSELNRSQIKRGV